MDDKLAKPHNANVVIVIVFGEMLEAATSSASFRYATNSLRTILVPSKEPIVVASVHSTPTIQAMGAKTQPNTISILKGAPIKLDKPVKSLIHPKKPLNIASNAMNANNIAPTFKANVKPTPAPDAAASIPLAFVFSTVISTEPVVAGTSVSGYNIFEITRAAGAAIKLAPNNCSANNC